MVLDGNKTIGDPQRFAFAIGPASSESDDSIRQIDYFIDGTQVSNCDNNAYIPAFIARLEETSHWLKSKINYVTFVEEFGDRNVVQIHEFLWQENGPIAGAHRFMEWGETTDDIVSFLIPYCEVLYVTCQVLELRSDANVAAQSAIVAGSAITPFELILSMEQTVEHLRDSR